jgi:hypothetical protein
MALDEVRQIEDNYVRNGGMLFGGQESRLVCKENKLARLQKYNDALLAKIGQLLVE